jgi:adenylate cyclase
MAKKEILVVDDETELVQAMQIRLEQADYEVLTAYDGEDGFLKAKQYKPDLIILDILMPHMGGDSMAAALKEDEGSRNIPIIFLSYLAGGPMREHKGTLKGGNLFLSKPFDHEELLSMVKALLNL